MTVQEQIRRYVIDEMGWSGEQKTLTDDLDLIDHHVLDSLAVVELSTLLEQWYGFRVEATELVYANFNSLGAIAKYVEHKRVAVQ
ncbi:MAG: acyl carrier protein [Corynebacteriales bacterium]|nr:acyl carrier protein [Mycobacteriales bacterium]